MKFGGGGLLYPPPLAIMAQIGTLKQTHNVHLHAKFRPDRFILSPFSGENPKFYRIFNFGIL